MLQTDIRLTFCALAGMCQPLMAHKARERDPRSQCMTSRSVLHRILGQPGSGPDMTQPRLLLIRSSKCNATSRSAAQAVHSGTPRAKVGEGVDPLRASLALA